MDACTCVSLSFFSSFVAVVFFLLIVFLCNFCLLTYIPNVSVTSILISPPISVTFPQQPPLQNNTKMTSNFAAYYSVEGISLHVPPSWNSLAVLLHPSFSTTRAHPPSFLLPHLQQTRNKNIPERSLGVGVEGIGE